MAMTLEDYKQKLKGAIKAKSKSTLLRWNEYLCYKELLEDICESQLKLIEALITISDYVGDHAQIVAQEALDELTKEQE